MTHRRVHAAAAALLALLLTGCPLTGGGGIDFTILALPTEPASITLAPGQSTVVRVSYSLSIDNPRGDLNSFACGTPLGVPGGLALTLPACPADAARGRDVDRVVDLDITVQAVTVPAGTHVLELPATLCVQTRGDASPGEADSCKTAAATLQVVVTAAPSVPDAWQPLGGAVNLDGNSHTEGPTLVVDPAGRPVVAFVENGRVVVRRWDGSAWQGFGSGPGGVLAQGTPALALDDSGAPVVAWTEARPGQAVATQVQARQWNGVAWQTIGGQPMEAADATSARDPAVLLLRADVLVLAWAEQTASEGGERIAVGRWVGTGFNNLMAERALPAPGLPARVSLARLDGPGLAVAWQDENTRRVQVAEVNAGTWGPIGDFAAINTDSFALAHAPGHGLLLATAPSPPAAQFTVQRYTGSGWQDFGTPQGQTATGATVLRLALGTEAASGAPLLAWGQFTTSIRQFEVRRWSGSHWAAVGDPLPPLARNAPGTPMALSVAGATRPLLATEALTTLPNDRAIRVLEFR